MRVFELSASSYDRVQRCPTKYYYGKVLRQVPKERKAYLDHGSLIHLMLEGYYLELILRHYELGVYHYESDYIAKVREKLERPKGHIDSPSERAESAVMFARRRSLDSKQFGENVAEAIEFVIPTFLALCVHHASDSWIPLAVEEPYSKVLFVREETPTEEGLIILLVGKIDLVAEESTGRRVVVDHKTTGRKLNPSSLGNQNKMYVFATGIQTFIVNEVGFQKTLAWADKFRRHTFTYSQGQIDTWAKNATAWALMTIDYIDSGFFPMSEADCRRCEFRPVCEAEPDERPAILEEQFKHDDFDLYEREDEEEPAHA
jgi:hypothetical protein